ncbi:MAG TPA: alpha/beta fold hydrolase [Terracidiphilus sp.]|nr:alpha/beta fold hydrolase [Terracidiphilus sp.]
MSSFEPFLDASTPGLPVRGFLHRSPHSDAGVLVLTHGAGSNCQAPLLFALAEAFCTAGVTVLRCDLPFRQLRPHGPPPPKSAERDQAGLRAAIDSVRRATHGRIFLGGHSYGGRQASILAASDSQIAESLLLLSFPLHPPERPTQLRSGHFPDLKVPSFFVHGVRDGFATSAEIEAALKLIPVPTRLLSVPGAGHEILSARNRDQLPQQIVEGFLNFVKSSN